MSSTVETPLQKFTKNLKEANVAAEDLLATLKELEEYL